MPSTATLVLDSVAGYSAPARVWRLDPPRPDGVEYVCTWVEGSTKFQNAEVVAVPCNERGAVLGWSVRKGGGSFTLHTDYDASPAYVDGAHWLALTMLGYSPAVVDLDKDAS